jgi:Fe-S-cluster containining protein
MIDFVLIVLQKFFLALAILDNFLLNSFKKLLFKPSQILQGKCKKCAKCCQEIALSISPNILEGKLTREFTIRWISFVYDFYLKEIDYKSSQLIFGCNNLSENNLCKVYFWRPSVCGNYPLVNYFEEPQFFDTCGFNKGTTSTPKSSLFQ